MKKPVSTTGGNHDQRKRENKDVIHNVLHRPSTGIESMSTRVSTGAVDNDLADMPPIRDPVSVNENQRIKAVPKNYRGTAFRSTLEADWAATFDHLGWHWEYEPVAVTLPNGENYRPDFYLPSQRVWCEVKGPHNERIAKTHNLQDGLGYEEWEWAWDLVVILRPPGPGETAQWSGTRDYQYIVIVLCPECGHYGFMDYNGLWSCRRHLDTKRSDAVGAKVPYKFWRHERGGIYDPGELPFVRAGVT